MGTLPTRSFLRESYSIGTVYTAHNQFFHFVHSGQFRADAKRCV